MNTSRHIALKSSVKKAFTLLEVIIAIALMGILFALTTGIVANVATLWEKSEHIATLDRHIAGINRFLNQLCSEQDAQILGRTQENANIVGCKWSVPAGIDENKFPEFTLKKIYPVIRTGEIPTPLLTAWLFWEENALWLIVQTPRQRLENEDMASYILLSEFFSSAAIQIWNAQTNSWEERYDVTEEDYSNSAIRLCLTFRNEKQERSFVLPVSKITLGGIVY